jgi:uncharacterized protein (DUF3084 family)
MVLIMQKLPPMERSTYLALLVVMTLTAVAGWGLFFLKSRSAAELEDHLRNQVSSLHQRQLELLNERTQMEAAAGTLEHLRSEVATLRTEHESLRQARDQVRAELAQARSEREMIAQQSSPADSRSAKTASSPTQDTKLNHDAIVTAQTALTKRGYGPLQTDGIVGPSTRQAIEDFQHDQGLKVTSQLDASTLRQLTSSSRTAARE